MTKPNILIWQWGRRGGGPRYTFELARALIEKNEMTVHLSLSRQSEIFGEFQTLNAPGLAVDTYRGLTSFLFNTLRLPFIRRRFWRYVKAQNIDLIVGTMSHVWDVPILLGRRSKVPYLMVLHDALPHRGDDVPLRDALLKREIEEADGVVALTEHVRTILCNEYGYPVDRAWVAPHGVFPYGAPAATKPEGSKLRLLFFGRIMPYKGLDLLLDAYTTLRKEQCPVELVIRGSGDLAPYAAQLAGLDDVTIDRRWIAENEIGPIFQEADIVVLPYHAASQSGVIATAYAVGVPVVVTPVGGLVEQVKHEQTGLIATAPTAAAIADAIRRMVHEPALRQRCAEGARHEAETALSWGVIANQFSEAVNQMLQKGKR